MIRTLAFLALATPAAAQECPITKDMVVGYLAATGGAVLADIPFAGDLADTYLIYKGPGGMYVMGECSVAPGLLLDAHAAPAAPPVRALPPVPETGA